MLSRRLLNLAYVFSHFKRIAFSSPSHSCQAASCLANLFKFVLHFMSVNFKPRHLVRQFHVRHFQRPRSAHRLDEMEQIKR